ncbi:hypothetical protein PFISCL1PPCAC_13742, partial [Pristionchus fissidentatus]
ADRRRGWLAALTVAALVAAAALDQASRTPDRTVPRVHRTAKCDPTAGDDARHLLMCKGAGAHNAALVAQFVERARGGLIVDGGEERWLMGDKAASTMASAVTDYYIALAMRTPEHYALNKIVHDFLMHTFKSVACTKLIEETEWRRKSEENEDGQESYLVPALLCTQAVFAGSVSANVARFDPSDLMKTAQRMALLFTLFGSEYHEAAVAMTSVIPLSAKRVTVATPTFVRLATNTYLADDPADTQFELMTAIWKTPRVAHPMLAPIVNKIVANFNVMCAKDPAPAATWNETFFASVRDYDRSGYFYATRSFTERLYHSFLARMRAVNADVFKASLKHSAYLTALVAVAAYMLSDLLPPSIRHWSLVPLTFAVSQCLIWSLIWYCPDCPLFTLFPELGPAPN